MPEQKEEVKIIYTQGCPEWMLTFGDCMSLLLCFFVMLMTFSTPDESKLMEMIGGLQGALGVVEPAINNPSRLTMSRPVDKEDNAGKIMRGDVERKRLDADEVSPISLRDVKIRNRVANMREDLHRLGFKNIVMVRQLEEGLQLEIQLDRLFPPDSDELKPGSSKWMEPFAGLVDSLGNEVRLVAEIPKNESAALSKKRLDALCFCLSSRYKVAPDRIGIGVDTIDKKGPALLKVVLADRMRTRELTLSDFFKTGAD